MLIKFWDYGPDGIQEQPTIELSQFEYRYISGYTNGKYFLIDLEDFNKKTSEYYGSSKSFVWGFSTLPIKIRFAGNNRSFQYETEFNLGINVGFERHIKSRVKQSIALLGGVGFSAIDISSETANNYTGEPTTVSAFTPSLGLVYSYESFQLGLFTGLDIIPGEHRKSWNYTNKPWLGVGLGFTIFQNNKTTNSEIQTQ